MPAFRIPSHVTHQTIDGEVIAIHFNTGHYFSMRGSAAAIWQQVAAGQPVERIAKIFPDAPPDAPEQIAAFVAQLGEADLLEEAPASTAGADAPAFEVPVWNPPVLESFSDLSQLLLADPIHDVEEAWPKVKDPAQA